MKALERELLFRCHHCDGTLEFPERKLTKVVECYHCGAKTLLSRPRGLIHQPVHSAAEMNGISNCRYCGGVLILSSAYEGRTVLCYHCGLENRLVGAGIRREAAPARPTATAARSLPEGKPTVAQTVPAVQNAVRVIQVLALILIVFNLLFFIIALIPGGVDKLGALLP